MKVKRTYRLEEETVSELKRIAESEDVTATEALERAVHAYGRAPDAEPYAGGVDEHLMCDVLVAQLSVKDAQIETLGRALEAAQETAKAAQALHAMGNRQTGVEALGLTGRTRWQRLRDAWRG